MREITLKYGGECRKCGQYLEAGERAVYERRVGIFCPACGPTETEQIRAYRQDGADRKADRLEEWAQKRVRKAEAVFEHNRQYTSDWAFVTQPGHIPLRARINKQEDRQLESLEVARRMQGRASSLRHVRVAGDAERKRQAKREKVLAWLQVGMTVDTILYGSGTVERINKKTATIGHCGQSKDYKTTVELSWLRPV